MLVDCPVPEKKLALKVFALLWAPRSIFMGLPGLEFLRRSATLMSRFDPN